MSYFEHKGAKIFGISSSSSIDIPKFLRGFFGKWFFFKLENLKKILFLHLFDPKWLTVQSANLFLSLCIQMGPLKTMKIFDVFRLIGKIYAIKNQFNSRKILAGVFLESFACKTMSNTNFSCLDLNLKYCCNLG